MAKAKYNTALNKAVLQVLEGCDAIASVFINNKVENKHKEKVNDAVTTRIRELKKQMDYVPPAQQFSLDDDEQEKKEEKKPSPKPEEKRDDGNNSTIPGANSAFNRPGN